MLYKKIHFHLFLILRHYYFKLIHFYVFKCINEFRMFKSVNVNKICFGLFITCI